MAPLHSAMTAFSKTIPPLESGGLITTPKLERYAPNLPAHWHPRVFPPANEFLLNMNAAYSQIPAWLRL